MKTVNTGTTAPAREDVLRKVLLTGGIISSLLYVAMNIFIPMLWPAYNSCSQTVSELSAIGAPTRLIWVILGTVYTLLVMGFGYGVWMRTTQNHPLERVGILIFIYGMISVIWPFTPMHQREVLAANGELLTDKLHLVMAGLSVLLMVSAIVFGSAAFGKWFRFYSIATLLLLLVFGILTALDAPRIKANLPTPYTGVWERINIGVFLLWIIVLALILIREKKTGTTE